MLESCGQAQDELEINLCPERLSAKKNRLKCRYFDPLGVCKLKC